MTNREIFKQAHRLTQKWVRRYPDADYGVTFSCSLRYIYAKRQGSGVITPTKLIRMGGKEWEKGNNWRIYFNTPEDFIGDEGRKIYGKIWYDCNTKSFGSRDVEAELASKVVAAIRAAA